MSEETLWQEANFTVGEALATKAFWILALFSVAGFMVQAGVSLHQVPHYIGQGVPAHLAALTAGTFAFGQIPGGLFWSSLGRIIPVRVLLALSRRVYSGFWSWRPAHAVAPGLGRLLWAATFGQYSGTNAAGANRRPGHRADSGRVHVRRHRRLPGAVHHLWGRRLAGRPLGVGRHSAGTDFKAGSTGGGRRRIASGLGRNGLPALHHEHWVARWAVVRV